MSENKQGDERPASTDRRSYIRALALLGASVVVFLFVVVMCIRLILQSAVVVQYPTQEINPIDYEVFTPVQTTTQPTTSEDETPTTDPSFTPQAPVSVNESTRINILLLGVEGEKNDTLIVASVDTVARTVGFLSIPRDTYISGDYDLPKAKQIYRSYDESRRISAVKEAVKDMFGFWVDYYFVLDEATLATMVSFTDGVEYTVPKNPSYHSLSSGEQVITEENAFELFRFKESWTDVETDPPRVQRYFLQSLFGELVKDQASVVNNSLTLASVAKTDLTAEQMAYLAILLADFDFENAFSRALPGGEKKIDGNTYYEVNIDQAVKMLNSELNPLQKELTVYNVHFRQEQGDSGDGEYSEYGAAATATTKKQETEASDDEPDETDDPDETETSETEPEETDSDSDE